VKARASILLSFAVGALAAALLVGFSSRGEAADQPARLVWTTPGEEAQRPTSSSQAAAAREAEAAPLAAARVPRPASMSIPRLGLEERIGTTLDLGPIWWPVTGRPGGGDTIAIAGHRTTHTRPFHDLDRLTPGDAIYVRWGGKVHTYRVSGNRIVSAKDLHIGDARGHEILLLSACHPKGSARQRIVVYAWPRP
jgi:sortase A